MAIIDTTRDVVVVRIVYDGAPAAGKTLSVQTLGKLLGKTNAVFTPELPDYPIVYFDWLEYTGGFFKGLAIACQIVSVPTHTTAQPYRDYLLSTADTVVFVADASSPKNLQASLPYFDHAREQLAAIHSHAPVEMVVQLNKQDSPHAVHEVEAKTYFNDCPDLSFSESSATLPKGIRETFILAVRLAVERLNILDNTRQLPHLPRPEVSTGEELLELFKAQLPALSLPITASVSPNVEIAVPEEIVLLADPSNQLDELSELEVLTELEALPELGEFAGEPQNLEDFDDLPELSDVADFSELNPVEEHDSVDEFLTEPDTAETPIVAPEISEPVASTPEILASVTAVSPPPETPETNVVSFAAAALKSNSKRLPKFPDEETPSQWIWPPLSGKLILNQVAQHALKPTLQEDGTWMVNTKEGWRCFSKLAWQYPELDGAKAALREQIALHLRCSSLLSEQRCVVIAEERKNWRLWQILHTEPCLAQALQTAIHAETPESSAQQLLKCAQNMLNFYRTVNSYAAEFKFSLANIAVDNAQNLIYLGTLDKTAQTLASLSTAELLTQEFLPVLHRAVQQEELAVEALVEIFADYAEGSEAELVEQLTELCIAAL